MRNDGQTDGHNESDLKFFERAKILQYLICVIDAVYFLKMAPKSVVYLF
jgi:hypothetical protein